MKVAVVYNEPVKGRPDSEDVLDQVKLVCDALKGLGEEFSQFPVRNASSGLRGLPYLSRKSQSDGFPLGDSVVLTMLSLKKFNPDVIVNLLEEINDRQEFQALFIMIYEAMGYAYTGSDQSAVLTATDKVLAKRVMKAAGIPTPEFEVYRGEGDFKIAFQGPWIAKPALEDASVGVNDSSIFDSEKELKMRIPEIHQRYGRQPLLIEQFIEGREFNVSMLETPEGVEVLPVAEMTFRDWPANKPRIVGYNAKWAEGSFEYDNTVRRFMPEGADIDGMREVSMKCWREFGLRGYARVDLRLSALGGIYVLEANPNPCISATSGFIAAVKEGGYSDEKFVKAIIHAALHRYETKSNH